jgi:phosphatidylglycerol lysyltransferase
MLSRKTRIGIWTAALLTGLVGIVNLISAVNRSMPERLLILQEIFPGSIRSSGHVFAALSGFVLLTLATNLLRRKRVAWGVTVALLLVSIASHLVKGLDYEESLLAGILLLQLLLLRSAFNAQSDRPALSQGVRVLFGALLFTVAYGTLGFYYLDDQFQENFTWGHAFVQTLAMFFTADNAGLTPKTRFGEFFSDSIYIVGAGTLAYALWMILRPVWMPAASPQERERARAIIDQYGQTSLARLSLLSDKSYYFSPSGKSVVAYLAKGRVALSLGSAIGPGMDLREATLGFQEFCACQDWFACFYEVPPADLAMYTDMGYCSLKIGEEAVIDLKTFNTKGKANQNLRTAQNRLSKEGFQAKVLSPPISAAKLRQLRLVSDAWLRSTSGGEKQFSMGWFHDAYLRDCQIGIVTDSEGHIVAFASLLEGYNQPEVTVDLMRFLPDLPNGTMDFLFLAMILHFQAQGYAGFNFSLSPLAGLGETPASPRLEKTLAYLSRHLNQFYNFKGLHFFKEKFHPQWYPRYLMYPRLANLPDVVVALVRADSGDRLLDYFKPGA